MAENRRVQLLPEDVFIARATESMDNAIEFVGGLLVARGIAPPTYVDSMKRREKIASTYLGNGVALPHGTHESLGEIDGAGLVIAQYPDGVDWGGVGRAHLVIGLAAAGTDHVPLLSGIAEAVQDEDQSRFLWTCDDPAELLARFNEVGYDDDENQVVVVERGIIVCNPVGLHARPVAQIVKLAQSLEAEITIVKGDKVGNGHSTLSMLAMGVMNGDRVVVQATGKDAEIAVQQVSEVLKDLT